MKKDNAVRWGLTLGLFAALLHLVWVLVVALAPRGAQQFVNWKLTLHHIAIPVAIRSFDPANAALLVVVAFVWGFVAGWLLEKVSEFVWKKC